jgi:sulP: sulfate permease
MKAFGFRPKLYTALKNYSKELFMADLMAGIIVGIVALPLAIAFGIASGVSPEKGIITAIIAGFIISLMGGSKVQIGGPTGAFIVIIYGIIQQYGESGLIVATLMAGVLLILLGVFKLGAVIKFIPYPIIVGFTSGIAVTIFTTQIADIFGLTFRRRESSGRLCRKMDDLFPTFRYRKLVEHDCKYCQHLHHCHYTAVLEEDSGVTYCHHRGDSGSLADESIWRH